MFFSMKRSVVVFVALGLLAGLVGCGGSTDSSSDPLSEAETEARQLLIDATTENLKPIFAEGGAELTILETLPVFPLGNLQPAI